MAPRCGQQDRLHGQHCLSSPRSASRGDFSGFARHRCSGGEAGAPRAAKLRDCLPKPGLTASKTPFPSPGVRCLSRVLLYSSACGTEGTNHTGLGKKDLGHKYPTKCCGPFLSDLTCLLINCHIFLPSAKDCLMPVSEAGFCCL